MAGKQDRPPLRPAQLPEQGGHLPLAHRVQPVEGLVQDQHLRPVAQCPGQGQPLAHPQRIGPHRSVVGTVQPHPCQQRGGVSAALHAGQVEPQVFGGRQVFVKHRRLDQAAGVPQHLGGLPQAVQPQHRGAAGCGAQKTQQQLEQGGLAGAVFPQQCVQRSPLHRQGTGAEPLPPGKALGELPGADGDFGHSDLLSVQQV